MKCPHCEAENQEGRKLYSVCGKPLQIKCPSWGAINEPSESYWGECGSALVESALLASTSQLGPSPISQPPSRLIPSSFANGCYQVKKFLGEGGKKMAHYTVLDRGAAFALIKTEKLDTAARALTVCIPTSDLEGHPYDAR